MTRRCLTSSTDDTADKPRQKNGTFASIGIMTEAKRRKSEKRRAYSARKDLMKKQIFDSFLRVFFLVGSADDWIPVSSTTGPLMNLAQRLFKTTFLLSKEDQGKKLRLAFFGGDLRDVHQIKKRLSTRDANSTDGPSSRVLFFEGRRLPQIENYSTEIDPMKDWVREHFDGGFFKCNSFDEAFSICLDVIKSYVIVNGKRAYRGYPKAPVRQNIAGLSDKSSSTGEGSTRIGDNDISGLNTPSQQREQPSDQRTIVNDDSSLPTQERETTVNGEQDSDFRDRRNEALSTNVSVLFEIACSNATFCILALLFDREIVNKYELIAAAWIQKNPLQGGALDNLSKDVLLYAHWQCFGIKNRTEHENRLKGLRLMLDLVTQAREAYGLKPYSELRDTYL